MTGDAPTLLLDLPAVDRLGRDVLFVDARRAGDYRRGHIPGAIHLDTFEYSNEHTDVDGLPVVARDWATMFAAAGIPYDRPVVFYDSGTENRAARPAFMLRVLGHPAVHVLHGGMWAWLRAGRDLGHGNPHQDRPSDPRPAGLRRPELVATVDDVAAALRRATPLLLDVRPDEEHDGRIRLQWNPRLGHIPGSLHIPWTDFLEAEARFPHEVGTPWFRTYLLTQLRPASDLRRLLASRGVQPDTPVILYCQRSHRASTIAMAFERLGYQHVQVYIGSFREWSRRRDLPVVRPRAVASPSPARSMRA